MKRKVIAIFMVWVCMFSAVSCTHRKQTTGSGIERFSTTQISSTYQTDIYSDYIDAVVDYYNEIISLCDDLVNSDYTTLIDSSALDRYKKTIEDESLYIRQNPKITKEQQGELAHINTIVYATAYQVAKYNSNHVVIQIVHDSIIEKGEKGESIDDYYEVVKSIEGMREALYSYKAH